MVGKAVFKALDKNGDGVLNGDEAGGIFKNYGINKNTASSNYAESPWDSQYHGGQHYDQPQASNYNRRHEQDYYQPTHDQDFYNNQRNNSHNNKYY